MTLVLALLLVWVAGSLVFCGLVIQAARDYLRSRAPALRTAVPISVLKSLHGIDEGLDDNLRSFLAQDYPQFEILFGVDEAGDAALPVAEAVMKEFPHVPCRCLVTGKSTYQNPKVYSLERLAAAAQYDVLVMSDSDIRVTPNMLRVIAAEFQDENLGVTTCPYRAVPGQGFWSRLEAIGMNTEFTAGILVARLVEGMKFGVGPTMVVRKRVLEAIGGFERVKDSYIDDFLLARYAADEGFGVALSSYVIEHRIGSQRFAANMRHRITWLRGTRRSRPKGYFGQVFTYPIPAALVLVGFSPLWWPLLLAATALRLVSAWAVAGWVLHDPLFARRWWLTPLQDIISFLFWIAALFGNTVFWRGRKHVLLPDGNFRPLEPQRRAPTGG